MRPLPPCARRAAPTPRRAGRGAAWLLFLPAVLLLSFALWQRSRGPSVPPVGSEPEAPERTGLDGRVEGWEASGAGPSGAVLTVRLERLHPVPSRQEFDRAALRRAFPAATTNDGEPWRLTLSAAEVPGSSATARVVESLEGVAVRGLAPLVRAGGTARGADPLASLFAPPAEPLHGGEQVDLVFWGPDPGERVRVELPGWDAPLELGRAAREGDSSTRSLASLDRRTPAGRDDDGAEGDR